MMKRKYGLSSPGMRAAAALSISALLIIGVGAQSGSQWYSTDMRLDWEERSVVFSVSVDLKAIGASMPRARVDAEAMIERDLAGIVKDRIFSLPVDSYRDMGGTVEDGTIDVNDLLGILDARTRISSSFTPDMRYFRASYLYKLTNFAALYVRHLAPTPLPSSMDYQPSRAYTGIVIYAKGSLPVHGEYLSAPLQPCLFPRIYDSAMNLVLERNSVHPAAIARWGTVGYSSSTSGESLKTRVGDAPLRILAEGLFGSRKTDVIISRADALKITGRPENGLLIEQGRVVLVCDLAAGVVDPSK